MPTATSNHRAHTDAPVTSEAGTGVEVRSSAALWWRVYLHHLRLLRNGAIAWITGLAGLGWGVVATFDMRHGTEEELQALAELEGIPAFEALSGRYVQVATVEGLTLSRWGWFAILAAVWGMLSAAKLFRGAEEGGHLEPLRAGAISPRGLLGSVLAALFTVHALFAVAIGLGHSAGGMDVATAWATGGAMGLLTAVFAAAVALTSQLVATRRRVVGIVGMALGVALGLRVVAAASATPDWVWWTTPFGWIGFLHEVDESRRWVFLGLGVLLTVLVVVAIATAPRDLHAGLSGSRAEVVGRRPTAVGGDIGLAVRLTAASARTWGLAVALLLVVFGLLTRDFAEAAAALPATIEMAAQMGVVGIDTAVGIIAWAFAFAALLLAVFVAGQVAAIREEEASWRIEHLLVRPVGRLRWLATRVLTATVAVAVIAVVGGVFAWAATALVGAPITITDALLGAINLIPVAWLILGVGVGLFGLVPRHAAALTYGVVVVAYLLDFVGGLLELPAWVLDLSPFRHVNSVPAVDMNVGAALVMIAVGVIAAAVGMVAFRRRDLQEA